MAHPEGTIVHLGFGAVKPSRLFASLLVHRYEVALLVLLLMLTATLSIPVFIS